jgi:hypothetical protein
LGNYTVKRNISALLYDVTLTLLGLFERAFMQKINCIEMFYRNGSFTILTIGDLLPPSIPISSVDEQFWNTFETKRESPWKR